MTHHDHFETHLMNYHYFSPSQNAITVPNSVFLRESLRVKAKVGHDSVTCVHGVEMRVALILLLLVHGLPSPPTQDADI